ncbi:MAG: Iron-sulfur cluster carrier protein [Chlamydiae bacterium]|nr:Iron-sulfur cluster carrier protein [Chlamydiota bacterium]
MTGLKVLQDSKKESQQSKIRSILAIAAGKGGVGKSSVAVNLALALKSQGFKVGLLDADIYGPSLEQMLPKGIAPAENPEDLERLLPALAFGIPFISIAHFKKKASIVRAPIANQIIQQFLTIIDWGELDYLLIDFPPGTGDIQLTLMQKAKISAAVVVTTPQVVATLDVSKAVQLFQKMEIPVLGVIENMSYLMLGEEKIFPFGSGGGEALAKEFSFPILGQIPIDPKISEMGDHGESLFEKAPDSPGAKAFFAILKKVLSEEKKVEKGEISVRSGDVHHLEIEIEGNWRSISLHEIQKRCPCAGCENQKNCDKEVSLLEFSPVGRYALKITFSSGCNKGIYPFALLKKIM